MIANTEQTIAYTGQRPDIEAQVSASALRILDVGCSNGTLGAALKAHDSKRFICGIEKDPVLYAEALKHLDRVHRCDLNGLNWKSWAHDEKFDCILFADVLEHLIEPESTLKESLSLLKKGGQVIVSLPNIRHISAFWSIYIEGSFPRRNRGIFDATHLRWFTLDDACRLLEGSGLKIIDIGSTLRLQDQPGGRINDFVENRFEAFKKLKLFREFMSYQFIIKSEL